MSNRKRTAHRIPFTRFFHPHLRTFTPPTTPSLARLPPSQALNASDQSPASPPVCATNTCPPEPPPDVKCCKRHDALPLPDLARSSRVKAHRNDHLDSA